MGLNFQTMTIINNNVDKDSKGAVLFEAAGSKFKVKRVGEFDASKVLSARKTAGSNPVMCSATIDFLKLANELSTKFTGKQYARLDIYLGVEGASPFIYNIQSPNEVLKGIPFWIEFKVDSGKAMAQAVADAIKRNAIFQCDKDLIDVTTTIATAHGEPSDPDYVAADAALLTLTGATEFQRFRKVAISVFDGSDDYSDVAATLDTDTANNSNAIIKLNTYGANGFGTYSQIVKDLRLPTIENYQPWHIRENEAPVPGELYDQYIIDYKDEASNDGMMFVGQRGESATTHVFWVRQGAVSTAFATAIGNATITLTV